MEVNWQELTGFTLAFLLFVADTGPFSQLEIMVAITFLRLDVSIRRYVSHGCSVCVVFWLVLS